MKTYKNLNSLKRWSKSFILPFVIVLGINNGYAQHVFSVTYNELSQENVRQINMQAERSRTAIAPLSRNMSGEYTFSLSADVRQNTKIILLNTETGGNVVITPTEYAPAEFVLSPFFIEELRQATLGDANSFLIMEAGADFSLRSVSTVSRATEDIFIPRMFYGTQENMREALPKDRRIVHIFKKRPRIIPAYPDDPENLRLIAQLEKEMSYFVYMYELPDGTFVIFDENFVSENATESTVESNTTSSNFGPLRFNLSGNLNRDQREVTQHALNLWGQHFWGRVPISVNVRAIPMSQGTLGTARQQPHYLNPVTRTWYSSALGNQLAGFNVVQGVYDILIEMNSGHNWNYSIESSHGGRFDWLTVILHEIAHGLGFVSLIYWDGTQQNNGRFVFRTPTDSLRFTDYPGAFDRQLFHGSTGLNNLPYLAQSHRATAVTSNDLFAGRPGSHLLVANNGNRVRMYAPNIWNFGSSVSHWHTSGTPYLMRPGRRSGERHSIDAREVAIMRDMGWPAPMAISGPNTICTQGSYIYEIQNLPQNATVTWWATPNNITPHTATGRTATFSRNMSQPTGPALISVTVNLPNGLTIPLTREVHVGPPNNQWISTRYNLTHVTPSVPFVDNALFHGFSGNLQSIDWVEWRRLSNVDINVHHSGVNVPGERATVTAHFPGSNTAAQAQIRLQNQCGPSPWVTIEYLRHVFSPPPPPPFCLNCFGVGCIICIPAAGPCTCMLYPCICMIAWGAVHPNPVSNVLTIDLTQVETPEAFTLSDRVRTSTSDRARTSEVFNIRLFNAHGMIVRQQRTRAATIQFDVSNLPEGTYYLHIEHNGEIEKHQIIVQRN